MLATLRDVVIVGIIMLIVVGIVLTIVIVLNNRAVQEPPGRAYSSMSPSMSTFTPSSTSMSTSMSTTFMEDPEMHSLSIEPTSTKDLADEMMLDDEVPPTLVKMEETPPLTYSKLKEILSKNETMKTELESYYNNYVQCHTRALLPLSDARTSDIEKQCMHAFINNLLSWNGKYRSSDFAVLINFMQDLISQNNTPPSQIHSHYESIFSKQLLSSVHVSVYG